MKAFQAPCPTSQGAVGCRWLKPSIVTLGSQAGSPPSSWHTRNGLNLFESSIALSPKWLVFVEHIFVIRVDLDVYPKLFEVLRLKKLMLHVCI